MVSDAAELDGGVPAGDTNGEGIAQDDTAQEAAQAIWIAQLNPKRRRASHARESGSAQRLASDLPQTTRIRYSLRTERLDREAVCCDYAGIVQHRIRRKNRNLRHE